MNFNFLKTPSTIAALLIVVLYFLPMTPYFKHVEESGDGDNKQVVTKTITGLGMLTGSSKESGTGKNYKEPSSDEIKAANEAYFGPKPDSQKDNKEWKAMFGILDKLSILIAIGAGLLIFVAYQKSSGQKAVLDDDKLAWAKMIVIGLGLMIFSRYCFMTGSTTNDSAGLGAWISLLAVIFLALETRIMKLMGK